MTLPVYCPVKPLGFFADHCWYLDPHGKMASIMPAAHSKMAMLALFSPHRLYAGPDQVARDLISACEEAGLYTPPDREVGRVWLEARARVERDQARLASSMDAASKNCSTCDEASAAASGWSASGSMRKTSASAVNAMDRTSSRDSTPLPTSRASSDEKMMASIIAAFVGCMIQVLDVALTACTDAADSPKGKGGLDPQKVAAFLAERAAAAGRAA